MAIFGLGKKGGKEEPKGSPHNSPEENNLLCDIITSQTYAEGGKRTSIERAWEDEYKIYQGGGKQWDTSKAPRTSKGKNRNFNSENNFVFPMIENMCSVLTATAPEGEFTGVEPGDNIPAQVLGDLAAFILERNEFRFQWKRIVKQGLMYGPFIGYVSWDQHWIGGSGPNRWVGEIRISCLKRNEFFSDPAILDLEERLQECSYINLRQRKKLGWFSEKWEKGKYVIEDADKLPKGLEDEGQDPQQATLLTHFHKGVPKFVPDEWKQRFLARAQEAETENRLPYYAKDLRDMAAGTLKGVHCAYSANNILLDYIPYIYDDGLYPFVYRVLYADELQPWGMGEIRNVVSPQILYNKADEIELGAMLGQGLGGFYYNKGALSEPQKEELLDSLAKANACHEVMDIHSMRDKQAVQVPTSIMSYKENKRRNINDISQNTDVMQGKSIGANTPYATVAELGARADIRTKGKIEVLEDFMQKLLRLVVSRMAQFYTEDRTYRILGDRQLAMVQSEAYRTLEQIASMPQGTPPEQQIQAMIDLLMLVKQQQDKPKTRKFNKGMLVRTWEREVDENRKPMLEEFVPEFDIKVKVVDERPTDRNYYVNLATSVLGKALGVKNFWKIIDEGKLPPIKDILQELDEMQSIQAQAQAQAQQAMLQTQQQEKEMDKQASLEKIDRQNQSMEKQVAMSAMAKAGQL